MFGEIKEYSQLSFHPSSFTCDKLLLLLFIFFIYFNSFVFFLVGVDCQIKEKKNVVQDIYPNISFKRQIYYKNHVQ